MTKSVIRAVAILGALLPLAGCLSYTAAPSPTPVVVTAPPPGSETVIKPAY
jgi:ABC-type glycerol-3-phosphate transport system substrate-binding protein